MIRGTWSVGKHEMGDRQLSGIEHDQTLGPLLVHDSVAALPAPDGVPRSDLVLGVALTADVDHRGLGLGGFLISLHENTYFLV